MNRLTLSLLWIAIFVAILATPVIAATEPPTPLPGPAPIVAAIRDPQYTIPDPAVQLAAIMSARPEAGAIVTLMDTYNPRLTDGERLEIVDSVLDSAGRWGLDPLLVAAVIAHESSFRPRAVSPCHARGLMQITRHLKGYYTDPFDIKQNIEAGCRYLAQGAHRGTSLALAGYNAGHGSARRALNEYRETRTYVRRVIRTWKRLKTGGQVMKPEIVIRGARLEKISEINDLIVNALADDCVRELFQFEDDECHGDDTEKSCVSHVQHLIVFECESQPKSTEEAQS